MLIFNIKIDQFSSCQVHPLSQSVLRNSSFGRIQRYRLVKKIETAVRSKELDSNLKGREFEVR